MSSAALLVSARGFRSNLTCDGMRAVFAAFSDLTIIHPLLVSWASGTRGATWRAITTPRRLCYKNFGWKTLWTCHGP